MEQNIDEIIEKAESSNTLQIEDFEISDEHFERISKLTNLKYLYFHRIKNTNFPLSLSNLQFLEAFTATGEQITYIPSFLPNLPKLKYLNLGNTNIKDFSLLAKISNLNSLFLNNCKLNSIPKEILTLKLLKILSLNQNNISILPDDINQLKELKNIDISNNPLNSLQFGYLFTDEKRNFRYRFSELINNENKENDLFNFQDKNLSLTYSDNFIFFQNKENHGFIQIIEHVNEIELFRRKDAYSKYENSGGFIIYVFGNNEKQLETLILLRKHIEDWIKKNEIKYVSLISKRKEEMPHIANCMRFFYYRGNLLIKEIKGREFVIDFEKLLEYKSLEKNTYFDDEHGREIPIEDLLKFIGAENEKVKTQWVGSQYITKIEIENFKIFSKLNSDLSKHINILIGRNGLGKTSFLQALTLGLLPLSNVDKSNELEKYISFNFNKSDITLWWGDEYRRIFVFKNELKHENYLDFPQKLILAYGVNLNTDEKLSHSDIIEQLIQGNGLSYSTKSIFKDYSTDFYDPLILLERLFIEKKGKENKKIDIIINLIKNTLNNFLDLFSLPEKISLQGDFANYYYIDLNKNKLKTNNLSEGYKDFILQITDIILRIIASRNFIFGNKKVDISVNMLKKVAGIIIIDEFDRHLHPELQRKLLDKLKEYFENIQFILSTHNIFSLQSAEGYTALIIIPEDNKLQIISKEISKGLSLESIFNLYFNGNDSFFGYQTEILLEKFKNYIDKQRKQDLTNKEKKEFKKITNELLNYSEVIKGIVTREIRQFERITDKSVEI